MADKRIVMLLMTVGSIIGGYIPALFGASMFSVTSIITGAIGGIIGVWIGMKINY